MTLKRPLFAALAAAAALGLPAASASSLSELIHDAMGPTLTGSGTLKSETRQVGAFDVVQSKGSIDVEVRIAPQAAVTVEADDNVLGVIRTRVEDGILVVDTQGNWSSHHDPVVHIAVPHLKALGIDGSGDAKLIGYSGEKLGIRVRGSGDVHGDGRVDNLKIVIQGSGDVDLKNLEAKDAQVRIDGSGDASVDVSKSLDATIHGSGDVTWSGAATDVKSETYGSGELIHK